MDTGLEARLERIESLMVAMHEVVMFYGDVAPVAKSEQGDSRSPVQGNKAPEVKTPSETRGIERVEEQLALIGSNLSAVTRKMSSLEEFVRSSTHKVIKSHHEILAFTARCNSAKPDLPRADGASDVEEASSFPKKAVIPIETAAAAGDLVLQQNAGEAGRDNGEERLKQMESTCRVPGGVIKTGGGGGGVVQANGAGGRPATQARSDSRLPASRGSPACVPADWVSPPPDSSLGMPDTGQHSLEISGYGDGSVRAGTGRTSPPRRAGKNISGVWVQDSRPGHVELIQSDDMEGTFRTRL